MQEEIIKKDEDVKIEDNILKQSLKRKEENLIRQNRKFKSLKADFQNLNYEKRKEFSKELLASDQEFENKDPCLHMEGDLVWVNVKESPLWPAMITIPQNESSYMKFRLKKSTIGPRQYHVQLFGDNYRTMWVSSKTIFIYEGLKNLRLYCKKLKLYVKSCKNSNLSSERNLLKAFSKLSSRTKSSNNSKSLKWNQAILEADQVLPLERCERILKLKAPQVKEIKEKYLYESPVVEENYDASKSSINLNSVSNSTCLDESKWKSLSSTCDSSDEFSNFEEDCSIERRNPKGRNSIKRLKQRSEEDLLDSDLDIKHELEIKEEPLELCDEYLCHENESNDESMMDNKQASEICTENAPRIACRNNFGKIEVKHEETFDEVHDGDTEDNDYDMKADIDVKNEDIEDLIEDKGLNLNDDVICERNFGAKTRGIKNKPKKRTAIYDSPSPSSSGLGNEKRNIIEHKNEERKEEGNKIKDFESGKRIKLDANFECSLCEYKTNRKIYLKSHSLVHLTEKLFKCSECDYECNHKNGLKLHLLSHSNTHQTKKNQRSK